MLFSGIHKKQVVLRCAKLRKAYIVFIVKLSKVKLNSSQIENVNILRWPLDKPGWKKT